MLFGLLLLAPTVLVFALFVRHERAGVAAAHLFLAILFHPATALNPPEYTDKGAQMVLLTKIHANGVDPVEQGYWSYQLSRSLQDNERLDLKVNNPMKYWIYPPTVVLFIWAGIAFLFFPVTNRRKITLG